ncbi:unnamed protein product [Tuber aestivum]|uniref:Uncharacterized protein n=1 Tax=Tuber aestivum TaxID=59557 RepID=A0A292PMD4_9PEZI|nr:unnamed protein product [Tuber aestivum]
MKTVSTVSFPFQHDRLEFPKYANDCLDKLCATSTVGIAACGYALARPCTGNDLNDHLTNATVHSNNFITPLIRKPAGSNGKVIGSVDNANQPEIPPLHANFSRPSTSRKWLRRLSVSFSSSSSSGSSPATSTNSSSFSSRSRSQSASLDASAPNSRPPTRSKLLKRSPSQRLAGSPSVPSHLRRPSTAVIQSTPLAKSSHLAPIHASRPSTSALESNPPRLPPQEPQDSWRVFFSAKRQKARSSSAAGGKLTKFAGIRRIYPSQPRQEPSAPTLMLAPSVETPDYDAASILSGAASLFFDSRPGTRIGDFSQSRDRPSTSANMAAPKRHVRRSLSISNILPINGPRRHGQDDKGLDGEGEGGDALVGLCSTDLGVTRRFSEPLVDSPYLLLPRPASPMGGGGDPLPPIQSLSALELDMEALPATNTDGLDDYRLEALSPVDPGHEADTDDDEEEVDSEPFPRGGRHHQHRLSVISASERASTLVGSEDLGHFEGDDFQSETVFDSVRTRVSEPTPVRLDAIFHLPPPEPSEHHLPMGSAKSVMSSDITPTKGSDVPSPSTPTVLTPHFQRSNMSDDDDDGSSSDWDLPSKSVDDAGELRVPASSGLRPLSGIHLSSRLGLNLNNASSTSFGTALEGLSIDSSSIRETSSILEWSESIPNNGTPPSLSRRSKAIHAKESLLSGSRAGRRVPSFHIRSQSVPVVGAVRAVPSPSENWDDDFLDDDGDGGFGFTRREMTIPPEIEERQASVIGHLGCVREFALLVEDLKRLRDIGNASGLRTGPNKHLLEEADGIIALATLDDEDTLPSVQLDRSQNRSSWHTPSRNSEMTLDDDFKSTPRNRRRSSILLPDDDVFGGGNLPTTPSFPHLRHGFRSPSASSSPSPLSKKSIDKNDPVEVAKGIMERMQLQHWQRSDSLIGSGKSKGAWNGGKVQFDTDMLRELVVHVGGLKRDLAELVDCLDSPSLKKHPHYLTSDVVESPTTLEAGEYGLEIGPGMSPFDQEGCGSGLEKVRSNNGVDFRPIVGVV